MARIDIPDSMVPEGYEIVETKRAARLNGAIEDQLCVTVYLRRKPRLKRIVFTVAGEKRMINGGEWFLSEPEHQPITACVGGFREPRIPLTRTEEY